MRSGGKTLAETLAACFTAAAALAAIIFLAYSPAHRPSQVNRAKTAPEKTSFAVKTPVKFSSREGRPIPVRRVTVPGQKGKEQVERFYVQGGLHGDEQLAPRFVRWLMKRIASGKGPLTRVSKHRLVFDFMPLANPDGARAGGRYNARGVNLNRNFSVLWGKAQENPGKKAFSEPETRGIRRLFQNHDYTAAVDVHGYVRWVVAPSNPAKIARHGHDVTAQDIGFYRAWRLALSQKMELFRNYSLKTAGGLEDGGAFEDWAFWSQSTPAFCLELATPKRYVPPYRRPIENLTQTPKGPREDTFKRYEAFIARMFREAIRLREKGSQNATTVAAE